MTNKLMGWAAGIALAAGLALPALAQDDHWEGTISNTLWNVASNWSLGVVPPPGNPTNTFTGNVWLDVSSNGDNVITIPPGDVETPGVGNTNEVFNTIYGPEFGCTLNVYGSLTYDWLLFPVQNNPAAVRSYVNIFGNGSISTSGAAIGIGDAWFYHDAPYVTMNLYSNAQYNSFGGAGLWLAGHLNIYDNSSFLVNGYINMDFTPHQTDGTRDIDIGGGKLILPLNYINGSNLTYNGASGNIYSFIARGIVRAYGKMLDTNDLNITDNGTNTIVTPVPLGGALQKVYFQPLPRASLTAGSFEQTTLVGDYPSVTGVLLSSSEPGISPASFSAPLYSSSAPNVVSVDTNGMITAVNPGSATITAHVGQLTSTNSLTVTVLAAPTLIHEYKFSEPSGSTVITDSVPGNYPAWNGFVNGNVTLGNGQAILDGASGFIALNSGIVSGLDDVTIEAWVSFGASINPNATLFAFGGIDGAGAGENYVDFVPHNATTNASANFGIGDPGNAAETDAVLGSALDGATNEQVVVVYHLTAGSESFYTNGVLAATAVGGGLWNNLTDPGAFTGPFFLNQTVLGMTLGADTYNYIGASLYGGDPVLNASIDEFRIYNGALSASHILADHALGPNQFIGATTTVSLTAAGSGNNIVISWPTTSALVNLVSSPTLGAGAVWTPVAGNLSATGGNYQMTVTASGSARYFRLTQ
jgi:Bacterial Ig-like domain (group 2)